MYTGETTKLELPTAFVRLECYVAEVLQESGALNEFTTLVTSSIETIGGLYVVASDTPIQIVTPNTYLFDCTILDEGDELKLRVVVTNEGKFIMDHIQHLM